MTRSSLLRCSQFEFEDLFQSLVSRFPFVNSLEFIAPALSFAGSFTLHRHSKDRLRHRGDSDVGEWILFTSPTPFSQFVFLWCPSVSFAGGEDMNERLVKEDKHFVRLNKGRMVVRSDGAGVGWDSDSMGWAETVTVWSGLGDESLRKLGVHGERIKE